MKWIVGSLIVLVLVLAKTAAAEDTIFKDTTMILKAPIKALDLKKGDEFPVRVVVGDSGLLITSEYGPHLAGACISRGPGQKIP